MVDEKGSLRNGVVAAVLAAILAFVFVYISLIVFERYAWGVFVVVPCVSGILTVLVFDRSPKKTWWRSIGVSLLGGLFTSLGFLVFGMDGLICVVISLPVFLPSFVVGGLIGLIISKRKGNRKKQHVTGLIILCSIPMVLGFEARYEPTFNERKVVTRVTISGPVKDVWEEVIAFSRIEEPTEFIFQIGVAYPIDARIEGQGVGAVRYCNFSTGPFVEPITHWEEGHLLAFDVEDQPIPIVEVSPYKELHPPHLDWAVVSHKGEFRLYDLGSGVTELVGTTWYHTVMKPEAYWGRMSDRIIHVIHNRVLRHIKAEVESSGA